MKSAMRVGMVAMLCGSCMASAGCLEVDETDTAAAFESAEEAPLACGNGIPCADPGPTVIGPILPPSDLAVVGITCLGSQAKVAFKNVGIVPITQQWHYTITRSHGLPIGPSIGLSPLAVNQVYELPIPSGPHQAFHVKADSLGAILEASEANNVSTIQCP